MVRPDPDLFGDFYPAPRKLDRRATAGLIVEAAAGLDLTGDERHTDRADIIRLAHLAYALTHPAYLTEAEGAVIVSEAKDTPTNRKRFNHVLRGLRRLEVESAPGSGKYWALVDAETGPDYNRIGPPEWWL